MCGSQQPLEGADSAPPAFDVVRRRLIEHGGDGDGNIPLQSVFDMLTEPVQVQCGLWVERSETEQGFCSLPPDHEGRCNP